MKEEHEERVAVLYLKLVMNEFKNEGHDKRELSVVEEFGYRTLVVATTKEKRNFQEFCDGYDVYRISTRRFGKAVWMNYLNRIVAVVNFVAKVIKTDADIISGHDYIATLAGYVANVFKRHKAKLIYDSHEFELYRFAPNRTTLGRWLVKQVEGFLLRRVDLALMVGDKIADDVQKIYGLGMRPTVVRNIPTYWQLEPKKSAAMRKKLLEALGLSVNGFLLMYHGGIAPGRGIEYGIQALALLPEDMGLVIMGDENVPGMIGSLRSLAEKNGVSHRVLFHPAVSMTEMKNYIGAVDVELVLIEGDCCVSYKYSLPNKFFESIQACVPIVCASLPEMGGIVRQYDIGLLVKEDDRKDVAEAVLKLWEDKGLYDRLKRNMEKAKDDLCWEKERLKLEVAIQEMMGIRKDRWHFAGQ